MTRYIDADLLKADYFALPSTSGITVSTQYVSLFQILNAPTADVVEVVRCKDCKYFVDEGMYCENNIITQFDHFYCYYGERRTDDDRA